MALMGEAVLELLVLVVSEDSSRSAWFLDDDRTRWPALDVGGGGGGKFGAPIGFGESLEYNGGVEMGDSPE